jgi:hypothetical protein
MSAYSKIVERVQNRCQEPFCETTLDTFSSVGSGRVEGACKNMISRRLKQTGARWRVRRVNRKASLCCLVYSNGWKDYWFAQVARRNRNPLVPSCPPSDAAGCGIDFCTRGHNDGGAEYIPKVRVGSWLCTPMRIRPN